MTCYHINTYNYYIMITHRMHVFIYETPLKPMTRSPMAITKLIVKCPLKIDAYSVIHTDLTAPWIKTSTQCQQEKAP